MADDTGSVHRCHRCGELKPRNAYQPSEGRRNGWECRACRTARSMAVYWPNRQFINELKLSRGCADCGYNQHPAALEFDHLPGTVKRHKVSALMLSNRATILAEVAKCEVVCANCHAIRTVERERVNQTVAARRVDAGPVADPQCRLFD